MRSRTQILVWTLALAAGGPAPGQDPPREEVIALQAALEARGFSPGLVDGIEGPKTRIAVRAFQLAAGLPASGEFDAATREILGADPRAAVADYRIEPEDEKLVEYCPPDWLERSRRSALLHPTLGDRLAERFHTSERCLAHLNPGLDFDRLRAGDLIRAPRLRERALPPDAERIEIDLERKLILVAGPHGRLAGVLHCSVPADLAAAVRGDLAVSTVVADPGYTFDPKKWPEVIGVDRKLAIPPGPRSPVGSRWIGLDRAGVGIHGVPEPGNIGKTGSHGCFRLTNWDAAWLASVAAPGMAVRIADRSPLADALDDEAPAAGRAASTRCEPHAERTQ